MGQLADALRRKFKSPQDAMEALGLDSALITQQEPTMPQVARRSPTAILTQAALMGALVPHLAKDAALDLGPAVKGLTAKNFKAQRPTVLAATKKAFGALATDDAMPMAGGATPDDVIMKVLSMVEGQVGGGEPAMGMGAPGVPEADMTEGDDAGGLGPPTPPLAASRTVTRASAPRNSRPAQG